MSENIPHSLGGFRGAFESEHGRKPTEQEIWNAAIRSWRDITRQKSDSAKELEEVIADLLMYAGDNGYGHIDYADTMRHAAALLSAPALPVNAELVDACGRYEAALMAAFPNGAHGEAFTQWNEARKLLAKRAQAAQPVVVVPYETHLNNMRNAVDIFQSYVNGRTSKYLAQVSINALNEYLDASPLPQQKGVFDG